MSVPAELLEPKDTDPPYMTGLNPPQREAVLTTEGPVLMLAGAGTGKTRALTSRLAHLIYTERAWPSEILAVTFTNKAAREMRERMRAMIGDRVEGLSFLGTFHAIGARLLRRHAGLAGLESNFTILDTDDQLRLMKQIITGANLDEKRWPAKQLGGLIDRWKNRGWTPKDVPADESYAFADGKGADLYRAYQARLKELNAADFGDLLLEPLNIFRTNMDVLKQYQQRFRYVLVDEYQDTNTVQYLWLRLIAQGHGNICVVGDDDQSIYSWRGAEVANILRFEEDFPGAAVIRLEQNYRSTGNILGAAGGLIEKNSGRLGKTLWTEGDAGDPVHVVGVWDGPEEARRVGDDIESLRHRGASLDDVAILVRAQFQTREFEDRFIYIGLPYRIVGGFRFYERAEIRDALAFFRVLVQPADDLAFERIVNVPKRGMGEKSVQKVRALARQEQVPLSAAAAQIVQTADLPGAARKGLADLVENFRRWREQLEDTPHPELARIILEESGYIPMWQQDQSAEAQGRIENLNELTRAMEEFGSLESFLEHVSLVMENDAAREEPKVTIMTLHAAKGLEFDHVFLAGWEEGVFPSQRSLDEGGTKSLEEERRLAYVGITRAKKRAQITHAANRRIYGQWTSSIPSRFIGELPHDHVEQETTMSGGASLWRAALDDADPFAKVGRGSGRGPGWQRAASLGRAPRGTHQIEAKPVSVTVGKRARTDLSVGQRVFHQKFGNGTVTAIEGNKLEVDFDKAGSKRVLDSFVERT
ncbi:DNA helicase II [Pacificimonas flava]|uniref:DNA 3'-5' helicase n=2 Tax=Pacificimonas TaxID=1960290 RepID=A0A219B8K8_9SPHN|nr:MULTISPECIES: UvrD-helicase domain-containing protein [Pacificimonas]MBZ6378639.1 UvrD-helicase domain-containing protein [Pacificimonas aurantium]OWV34088.1 DNA helicase II [Pacificimonas flava]